MTENEQLAFAIKQAERGPIKIPETANIKIQLKQGYDQISYIWESNGYKYTARWHTRTPGAPIDQTNTWVIERRLPGNTTTQAQEFILIGEDDWISKKVWYEAIAARQSSTATEYQIKLLNNGHWKDKL